MEQKNRAITGALQYRFTRGLGWGELLRLVLKKTEKDRLFGRAAELAFFFLLAFFPMLIFMTAFGVMEDIQRQLLNWWSRILPPDAMGIVRNWLRNAASRQDNRVVSLGLIGSVWAAITAMISLMDALNTAYEVKENRPFWYGRLEALGLIVTLVFFVIGGTSLILFGDNLIVWIEGSLGLGQVVTMIWGAIDYLIGMLLVIIGIDIIYYIGPNTRQRWHFISAGALFSVFALIIVSTVFSIYLRYVPSYNVIYGSLGAVIVLMIWLYMLGFILILGAQINFVIDSESGRRKS